MNKESAMKAAKFAGGVLATLLVARLIKTNVAPSLPAPVQKVLGYVLP
jgi:hypothetical protein